MADATRFLAQAFGLRWRSDCPIPWFAAAPDDGRAIDIDITRHRKLAPRAGGQRINRGELFADGTRFSLDGAVIDMHDGERIAWSGPGPGVPLAVCGTVAGQLLAWRGLVPLHGSAVAFDGQAILIAGTSGAGKSTLAQALVDCGGQLVSDDLSALLPMGADGTPLLIPGRPAIRLSETMGDDKARPKRLAWPPRVDPDRPVPLAMLVVLRDEPIGSHPSARTATLAGQIFRPKWMRFMPGASQRRAIVFQAAQRIGFATLPPASAAASVMPATRAGHVVTLLRRRLAG